MTVKIDYTISRICRLIKGEWLSKKNDLPIEYLSLDSRKITEPSKTLFWAIDSKSRDGSGFIAELYAKGVRNFVTQKGIAGSKFKDANFIYVKDAVVALQQLAVAHRKRFKNIHVVGITGSNGKTIVKEWLSELLSQKYKVVKSPRSYNSQIGVPLSILQINDTHQFGIFEAGISTPGEMEKLERIIRPDTGIFTNIGSAHDEGFSSRKQKIQEKLLLFKKATSLVYPCGAKQIASVINETSDLDSIKKLGWGKGDCTIKLRSISRRSDYCAITLQYDDKLYIFSIPFKDEASVENAISCFGGLIAGNVSLAESLAGFAKLQSVSMRMEVKPGVHRSIVINDSYSNDLQALEIAVDFLKQQNHQKNTVILSDLLQTGLSNAELYARVSAILTRNKVDRLIGIGSNISVSKGAFGNIKERFFFPGTDSFLKAAGKFGFHDEAILVKGARKFSFEKISKLLEAHLHQTVLSVNLSALANNIRIYKSLLRPGTKLMALVKAFAYGAGSEQIGSLLQYIKADYLTVAYTEEGVALRDAGIDLPVMVMNVEQSSFDHLVQNNLEPEIFSVPLLRSFTEFLSAKRIKGYPVHIKIDTGMHRLGFESFQIAELLKELKVNKRIRVQSVFSHLSSSDNPLHDDFTRLQFSRFSDAVAQIGKVITYPFIRHICNSAAISRFPEFQLDMVRLGIGMYGIDDNPVIAPQLQVVNQLSTTISQIKKIKAGDVVGYGRQTVKDKKTIATVGIGYADGYKRLFGNGKGKMMINGHLVPTIGNVCMDMTMLDITGIKNIQEGDEVIVFGESLSVQKVAKWAGTIPYEIFTGISPRVRRIYFEEG